ncbi:MAG TPA: hypothetical protein VFM10_03460 [Terriglobales bacterium]|jgi:hypothetical protein|nr:hypothetical protein [Terriglobales bacterium]
MPTRRFGAFLICFLLIASICSLGQQPSRMETFQYMNLNTLPDAINEFRQIAGHLGDEPEGKLGFIRQADGRHKIFAYQLANCPSSVVSTWPMAINNFGTVAGMVYCGYLDLPSIGFVRRASGTVTFVRGPGGHSVVITGINDLGFTVGTIGGDGPDYKYRGFIRSPGGAIAYLDAGPNVTIFPLDINDYGTIVGMYQQKDAATNEVTNSGFIYKNGKYKLYRFGGDTRFTWIDNAIGEIFGEVRDDRFDRFLMKKNGQVHSISDQLSKYEVDAAVSALNGRGDIVGYGGSPSELHGFLVRHAVK